MEILYLGKIKKNDINPTSRQVIKNKYTIFGFVFFFRAIIAPGILQIENKSMGTICAGL